MNGKEKLLDNLMIAAPCTMNWEDMAGNDRVRHCQQCQLDVYNISDMTAGEAETFLRNQTDKACINLYRRADGTIITDNCPVGLRKLRAGLLKARESRNRLARLAAGALLLILGLPAQAKPNDPAVSPGMRGDVYVPPVSKMGEAVAPGTLPTSPTLPTQTDKAGKTIPAPGLEPHGQGPAAKSTPADRTAANFYKAAQDNEAQGKLLLAEINYKKALEAASKPGHDPKFQAKIKTDYANFLRKQNREKEAKLK